MSREIKISEVLDLMEQGKTRPEIREYYGLTVKEMSILSNHPQIKGKKAKVAVGITIIDDVTEEEIGFLDKEVNDTEFLNANKEVEFLNVDGKEFIGKIPDEEIPSATTEESSEAENTTTSSDERADVANMWEN